ncbi:MAG: hypothetical protein LBB75_08745 [Oscillospiraceae bacterium]|nr:hypothetical protein [Oscillospiraceae bacterium]
MKMKLKGVRVIKIPSFRAVSSGQKTFDEIFGEGGFDQWMQAHMHFVKMSIYGHAYDFMWPEDKGNSVWIWAIKDEMTEADCAPYEIIEYEGGMFVVATADEDNAKDRRAVTRTMAKWIEKSGVFERDERPGHRGMGHMVGCGAIQQALGFAQQEIFFPVKFKER